MTTPVGLSAGTVFDDDQLVNEGWITREDFSLKQALQGVRVLVRNDDGSMPNARKRMAVPVYFRIPEKEQRREVFPYLTIDFLDAARLPAEEHRGTAYWDGFGGTPAGTPLDGDEALSDWPIPMALRYQITAWARFNSHSREIIQQLTSGILEPRFGCLVIVGSDEAADDNSLRRLDLISGPTTSDTIMGGKRAFRTMWTISVASFLVPSDILALKKVHKVIFDPIPSSDSVHVSVYDTSTTVHTE